MAWDPGHSRGYSWEGLTVFPTRAAVRCSLVDGAPDGSFLSMRLLTGWFLSRIAVSPAEPVPTCLLRSVTLYLLSPSQKASVPYRATEATQALAAMATASGGVVLAGRSG